eukprot:GHVL01007470.1.p1 GENE.GHVL01007470.1~~GHVL01007470.1.p1  ORF type:complete len:551 (+),score=113.24 GHVL01007470.1:64-1716(+)
MCKRRNRVKMEKNDILRLSSVQLAKNIKLKKYKSIDVVNAFIDRIETVNLSLHAIVGKRYNEAREEARIADERIEKSDFLPFLGVPFLAKECFEIKGMPYTAGLRRRVGTVGETTCDPVKQLQDAGMILLGVGNTSEACMWVEAYNHVYPGRTSSPYDLSRTSGGSSGGTASMISAGGAPCGITSDVGGSTRIPCFFCGLFGHKPTGGTITNERTIPATGDGKVNNYCQLGPSCRHAEDLFPIFNLMKSVTDKTADDPCGLKKNNKTDDDPCGLKITEKTDDDPYGLKRLLTPRDKKLLVIVPMFGSKKTSLKMQNVEIMDDTRSRKLERSSSNMLMSTMDKKLIKKRDDVVAWMEQQDQYEVKRVWFREFNSALLFEMWGARLHLNRSESFHKVISEGKNDINTSWELMKCMFGQSDHTMPALGLALFENMYNWMPGRLHELDKYADEFYITLKDILTSNGSPGVLIIPTYPMMAPKHGSPLLKVYDAGYTGIFNVLEMPSTQVPLGLVDGLPTGSQIVSICGEDNVTIRLAIELEIAGLAKWEPPPER